MTDNYSQNWYRFCWMTVHANMYIYISVNFYFSICLCYIHKKISRNEHGNKFSIKEFYHQTAYGNGWTCLCIDVFHLLLSLNTLRPRQNGRPSADDIFKCIFLNENVWIPIKISLKFVPKGPINNIPAMVQIIAWRRPGDKPLSEPMVVSLPTHICVARPQWVNCWYWLYLGFFVCLLSSNKDQLLSLSFYALSRRR